MDFVRSLICLSLSALSICLLVRADLAKIFASLVEDGHVPFRMGISVEKEASAHRTLTLRAFLREYRARHGALPKQFIDFHAGLSSEPDWSSVDADAWQHATDEARALELGTEAAATAIDGTIEKLKAKYDDMILIGGPPCQAYSLVGRARSKGMVGYVPEEDQRHYLFREYIRVLDRLRPAAFVMENVTGMLSSTVESRLVFEMLMEDLSSLGTRRGHQYELRAIRIEVGKASLREAMRPSDFIVRAEEFGVPQRRHRVIIAGIRSDREQGSECRDRCLKVCADRQWIHWHDASIAQRHQSWCGQCSELETRSHRRGETSCRHLYREGT